MTFCIGKIGTLTWRVFLSKLSLIQKRVILCTFYSSDLGTVQLILTSEYSFKEMSHFGPAQVILFDFWPYLMQNALRNTFLIIKFDIHYNKVWYFLIQKVLDISCSPFCVPVGWLGRDQTFTLFTISSIFGSETSLVKKLDRLILDILRYVCSFRFI